MATFTNRRRGLLPSLLVTALSGILLAGCDGGGTTSNSSSPASPVASVPGNATDTILRLQWHPNADTTNGYVVYYGSTAGEATALAAQLDPGQLDPQAPSISFNAGLHLGLSTGDSVCFRLRAFKDAETSDLSEAVCTTI